MATADDHVGRIRRLQRAGVLRLWASIRAGDTPGWPPGKAFEHLILRAFELERATVTWPYSVELQGHEIEQIDGAVHLSDLHCLIEAKDEVGPSNVVPLAKLRNQLHRRPHGTTGILFAKSGFSDAARLLATYMVPLQILLWTGDELDYALAGGHMIDGLRLKYRYAVELGLPDFVIGPVG